MANELFIGRITSPLQPGRLLDIIPRIPPELLDPTNPLRWLVGVAWEPIPCGGLTASAADGPCLDHDATATLRTCSEPETQKPFRLEDAYRSSVLNESPGEIDQRLMLTWETLSAGFAKELLSGAASGGVSLSSTATAPTNIAFGAAAVSIEAAMSEIENELAERLFGRLGYIHVPPGLLSQAVSIYGVQPGPNGSWVTPAGNVVISDAGYVNAAAPSGQAASAAGSEWLYGSGPVLYNVSDPFIRDASSYDLTRNTMTRYMEGYGILVFDSCPVTAVLASYTA